MGTDRDRVHTQPCPCGKGTVYVDECSPDHPYARSYKPWLRHGVNCPHCSKVYTTVGNNEVFLVERQEYDRHDAAKRQKSQEVSAFREKMLVELENNGDISAIARHLSSFPTAIAASKYLGSLRIHVDSLPKFRGHFKKRACSSDWVKSHIYYKYLSVLILALGKSTTLVDKLLAEDESLQRRPDDVLKVMLPAIYRMGGQQGG